MDEIVSQMTGQSHLQWVALLTGLLYVFFAARARAICWIFGIICSISIAWEDFFALQLYADGVLQIIYVVLGFWGLYSWLRKGAANGNATFNHVELRTHIYAFGLSCAAGLPVWYILARYTDAAYGYLDTVTTLLSLFATWLLVKRVVSNWLYWIVIDAIYVYLFMRTGGVLIAVLYAVYVVIAVAGYFSWRKLAANGVIQSPSK